MTAWAIHDPVEQLLFEIPAELSIWIPIAAGALLIGVAWLRRRLRRRPRPGAAAGVGGTAGPDAGGSSIAAGDALAALDALANRLPADPAEEDAFHVAVAYILRRFIFAAFGVEALKMATEELVDAWMRTGGARAPAALLEGVLFRCDRVKFAGRSGGADAARGTLADARRFVAAVSPAGESP